MNWITYFTQFGYLGIFLISALGAFSVVVPIPYTLTYYILGAKLDPLLIAIAGGTGSALGEYGGYVLGYFGRILISEERKKKMFYLVKLFERHGPIVVFLFALTPLPDDLLFIPLGILRYKFIRLFIPCLLGKICMAYLLAYSGKISFQFINTIFGDGGGIIPIIFSMITLVIVVVVMLRIDWEKIFNKYMEKK